MLDISEEVRNAAIAAPVAIVAGGQSRIYTSINYKPISSNQLMGHTVAATAVLGFFLIISLCYGIRDLSALPGPSGLVFAQVILLTLPIGRS